MATSFLLRKSLTIPGAITLTGNTLGLTDKDYPYTFVGPGGLLGTTFTYIGNDLGTFITTDTSKTVPGYPAGTTNNWGENSSMAVLRLPQGAIVRHAELVWGGCTRGNGSNITSPQNLDSLINTPVKFKAPSGRVFDISPDAQTAATATVGHIVPVVNGTSFPYFGGDQLYYVRSQDVTAIVKEFGAGNYECGGVVANRVHFGVGLMRTCGWDLVVMYELPTLPVRNLNLFLGIDAVGSDGVASINYSNGTGTTTIIPAEVKGPRDINIQGFVTPETGNVEARILLSGMEGDPRFGTNGLGVGDRVFFGANTSVLTELVGPNNRIGNFLAAQINDDAGNLDTSGTFGTLNQNPTGSTTGLIRRNTWDITNLGGGGILPNSQRTAVVRIQSETDEYALHLLALQINVNAPNIQVNKKVDKQNANVGEEVTYTVVVKNTGTTTATNVVFKDSIPNDTSFVSGSVTVNGAPQASAIPTPPGFSIKDIAPNESVTVTFKVKINKLPNPNPIPNQALVNFKYRPAPDLPEQSGTSGSNIVNTLVEEVPNPSILAIKSVDKTSAVVGDTILYTVDLVNNGNTQLNNVIFRDTIPNGTSFVGGSVLVDNAAVPGANPQTGVNLNDFSVGQRTTVKWNVRIDTIPNPNPIPNTGYVDYNYVPGPGMPNVPGSKSTNTVNTNVANATPGLQVIKSVDKIEAAVGEILTYTTEFTNVGNVNLVNIVFKDTIPNDVTLIPDTTKVNGTQVSSDVQTGIPIGTMVVGEKVVVSFKVRINTLPNPNPIPNTSRVDFEFVPAPGQSPLGGFVDSNLVNTNVFKGINPILKLDKNVSQEKASIGDEIIYTIGVKNDGNVPLTNIVIKDTIPNGTSLVPGSTELNFVPITSGNIETGINIPLLPQDGLALITFKVKINQLPIPNPIPNVAIGSYEYIDVNGNTVPKGTTSNQVNTLVEIPVPKGEIEKTNDKIKAVVGEEITYSVRIKNTGTVSFNNTIFKDTIPNGTSFVGGSVTINGIANGSFNPQSGFTLGTIPVGGNVVVQFRVKIDTIPNPNPIPNGASLEFKYTTNPNNPNANSGSLNSNIVNTEVVEVRMNLTKSVDKTTAKIGDEITYTIIARNPSSVNLDNVVIRDTIPNGTTFVTNSVTVDGVQRSGSPQDGVEIGTIGANSQKIITFKVTITTTPNPNPIPNEAVANYEFRPDPTSPIKTGGETSNKVVTQVGPTGTGSASITKAVDKATAQVGEEVTYTSVISNTGNLPLTSLVFTDALEASNVSFVPGSLVINGASSIESPVGGVALPDLAVGSSVTVVFKARVNAIPVPNPIPNKSNIKYSYTPIGGVLTTDNKDSNTVFTQVLEPSGNGDANIVKAVDKSTANVGDTLTYGISVTNTGNLPLTNVIVTDTIQASNVSIIPGSLTVNGILNSGDLSQGVNIGNLAVGAVVLISYRAKVDGVPVPNPIPNKAKVDFTYTPIGGTPTNGSKESNLVTTNVQQIPVDKPITQVVKEVDKTISDIGGVLTYTLRATNTGTVIANNVVITDQIPNDTSFIPDSVTVNGASRVGLNPQSGVSIGNLSPGQSVVLTYKVKLVDGKLPSTNPVPNTGNLSYTYIPTQGGIPVPVNLESNLVETKVNAAIIPPGENGVVNPGVVKEVDKAIAKVGDELTYTIRVTNFGNISTESTILKDTIPNDTSFVVGSVTVDGTPRPNDSPQSGINLGIIAPNVTKVVKFKIKIERIPTPNPIENVAIVDYTYRPDPNGPVVSKTSPSNKVTTNVGEVPIKPGEGVIKTVSKNYAQIGDILTYTVKIKNTGNISATNIFFKDTIPKGTTFVLNSVTVDGALRSGVNPEAGFQIGDLTKGGERIVTFKVQVVEIPAKNPIENIAEIDYSYVINPGEPPVTTKVPSNPVTTQVNEAKITKEDGGIVKAVDKAFARVLDILTYTVTLKNTGNVPANNVILKDVVPNDTSFVLGSVKVNGIQSATFNPESGIPLGTIGVNQTVVVEFKVMIDKLPTPNPIPNTAEVSYNYTVDPANPNGASKTSESNLVTTKVNEGIIDPTKGDLVKTVDKEFAAVGDVLTYTVKVTNSGNTAALNVLFKDTIPQGTSYLPNTFTIDGGIIPGANPEVGVNIGNINPGVTKIVLFKVRVNEVPIENPIRNKANIEYEFVVNPITGEKDKDKATSNEVTTKINEAIIDPTKGDLVKSRDKEFAKIGDEINYTIKIRNSGNIDAESVVFYDTIPNGTSFVSNSVVVDGASRPNQSPSSGVSIGTIRPNQTVVVNFRVKVISMPNPNPIPNEGRVEFRYLVNPITSEYKDKKSISNTVFTKVNEAILAPDLGGIEKAVDKAFAKIGDILTYTITLRNKGNVSANNVILVDTVPEGTTFISDSVAVNGNPLGGVSPSNGIPVGVIEPLKASVVTFKVKVVKVPNLNPMPNKGEVSFKYTVDPNKPNGEEGHETSNTVLTKVNSANISNEDGGIVKEVDKSFADVGEVLTYTINLRNTGNVNAENVIMKDTVPDGTKFIEGSVQVNGQNIVGVNPETGIQVGTIVPSGNVRIVYKVKVEEMPVPNPIPNTANVSYSFIVNPQNPIPENVTNKSNEVYTKVNSPNIGPFNNSAVKAVDKAFAKVGEELTYTISVTNKGNVVATNVVIKDDIPEGTKFVLNSVIVNGTSQIGKDPSLGVTVSDILPGSTTVLSYKVVVISIPKVNPIPNKANVAYSFTKDPNRPNGERNEITTNEVKTQINSAIINPNNGGIIKEVDKNYADLGEVLTYTVKLKNTGNVVANNVVFRDTIPEGTQFVEGSLRVNGLERGENPQNGALIGSIAPNDTVVISFKVKVVKVLMPNVIKNKGEVSYTFTKDPSNPNGEKETNESNTVQTVINSADISFENGGLIKSVNKEFASIGDELVYTINLENKGNIAAEDVVVVDTIPLGTEFVGGSVVVNGVVQSASNPQNGIDIGLIPVGGKTTIKYKVKIVKMPTPNPIPNKANVSYKYLVNPITGTYNNKENTSNTVLTKVNTADISPENGGVIKEVDKKYADLNDILTYTITLQNKGNTQAIKVLVKDTIPKDTEFIENSITVNGVVRVSENPESGILIQTIKPQEIVTITFKVRVIKIPNPNVINNKANVSYSFIVDPNSQQEVEKNVTSNQVTTTINSGNVDPVTGGIVKAVDKEYASIGEELSYSIKVKNSGNVKIENVIVQDTVPEGTVFISGSILVNGVQRAGDNLASGINIGTLMPEQEALITYKVKVDKIPVENPIKNNADVSYTYTVDPNNPNGKNKKVTSNTVLTKINFASIDPETGGLVKSVNKLFTDLGEELLYTITLKNTGNVSANNIVLKDTIPTGTKFVLNSVLVNNTSILGANPELGINVGILEPNKISVVQFKVLVVSIPNGNIVKNDAIINYTYTKNPNEPNGVSEKEKSNTVNTEVKTGIITPGTVPTGPDGKPIIGPDGKPLPPTGGFTKKADKEFAVIGDIITYTFKIENTGNVTVNNVIVKDLVPESMKFVEGSISIDGVVKTGENTLNGVNIGSIKSQEFKTLSFKALVVSIPKVNPIKNKGVLTYEYTVDENKPPVKKGSESNTAEVTVNGARITPEDGGLIKQVDKEFAELNDTLTYTVILKNTGNVKANNVVLRDTIPEGTSFVPGSVFVNGNNEPTLNPQTGVGILVLNPGATAVITFKVKVEKLNVNFKIINNARVNYDFVVNPNEPPIKANSISNNVITKQNSVDFSGENFKKSVDNKYVSLNDVVDYTFTIKNTGNILATNVEFKDDIPEVLEFVKGSVTVNNISLPFANPEIGISLGSVGINEVMTLSFKALVISIPKNKVVENVGILSYASQINPNGNPVITTIPSNKEDINVLDPKVVIVKDVNKKEAIVGDVLDYTIKAKNTGNTEALNVKISDDLSEYLEFVKGSVTIDSKEYKDANIIAGVIIASIDVGKESIITFKAKVVKRPEDGEVSNIASGNYSYITDPTKGPRGESIESNKVTVKVSEAEIKVTKSSNIQFAKIDDVITYKVVMENVGTLEALNVIFFDKLSQNVEYVEGTFTVNGRKVNSIDMTRGVNISNIKPKEKVVIEYSVLLKWVGCNRKVKNAAYGVFGYKVTEKGSLNEKTTNIAEYVVIGQSPNFRQMNIDGTICIEPHMPSIEEVNEVKAEIEITNYYVIDTMIGRSPENANLTGQKLVINGFIYETIEYTALVEKQSAHYTCKKKKFSTFIVIQGKNTLGSQIQITPLIEDILFKQISEREIYTNITFNLDANING